MEIIKSDINDVIYSGTIIADTRNKRGHHPEMEQMLNLGLNLMIAPLPVGDYALSTPEFKKILDSKIDEQDYLRKFKRKNIVTTVSSIDFAGTYHKAIDTKGTISELYKNVTLLGERYRFERECMRAKNLGIDLIILLTDHRYHSKEDVSKYVSPSGYIYAGVEMLRAMEKLEFLYPVTFEFLADNENAGKKIADHLLSDESNL